jgi:hypothetical protein
MKTKITPELARFKTALKRVLQVSKSDLNQMLADEKIANEGKPKRGPKPKHFSDDHASGGTATADKD